MTEDLHSQLKRYTQAVLDQQQPITDMEARAQASPIRELSGSLESNALPTQRRIALLAGPALAVLLLVGGVAWLTQFSGRDIVADSPAGPADFSTQFSTQNLATQSEQIDAMRFGSEVVADGSGVAPSGGSPLPDVGGSVVGDDGLGPLALGSVAVLPGSVQVDFLFEFCWGPCFRDGHFMDPEGSGLGSGPFTSDTPFYVRHGFVNNGEEPLGVGFDVVIYVTALDMPGESGGRSVGETYRYTSDYVIQGSSEACGPTYRTQTGAETCEWFVHEFAEGLPEGRHALWAVWEAPCSAWVDYGFANSCADPSEVMSLFSSGFDSPFGPFPPSYTEASDANLSEAERQALQRDDGNGGS